MKKLVTDITEFHLFGQTLYLSVLLDLYSGDIVSYTISDWPVLKMVTSMLKKAFEKFQTGQTLFSTQIRAGTTSISGISRCCREKGFGRA